MDVRIRGEDIQTELDYPHFYAKDAGYFKSKNKMSFADAFAAALTRQQNAYLVRGDPDFKQVEREIKINWL